MNCLDKMYKEIEEILKREEQERIAEARPLKEIKRGFSSSFDSVEEITVTAVSRDYLSEISLADKDWQQKRFDEQKAKTFIKFIFNKYLCFNREGIDEIELSTFKNGIENKLNSSTDFIKTLTELENEFILISGVDKGEKTENYFLNPYNALFKDENGYYAVIEGNKFSDVRRPLSFNPNQMKKIIKETFDEYAEDFKSKCNSEKEMVAFMNTLKSDVNKSDMLDPMKLEETCEEKFFAFIEKKGVTKPSFDAYVEQKGLKILKQGNYYFRKKAYENYAEYKKIEFRY